MLLSVVTGTYNRLPYLTRMMQSVRDTLPASLPYDFVICDGGSTDGTLEWLREQTDVTVIEHGELKGAIRAFTDAGMAATGEFTILANDDITFEPGAILRALAYLESQPNCGAVAVADDRPAPGYENVSGYKVQTMTARTARGTPVSVPYAQVGLYRTWLMQHVGVWGADDPMMGQGKTYGADNWLTARILEQGYSVDAVEGVHVNDLIPNDALREHNYRVEQKNPSVYYKAYPDGPLMADTPQLDNPQREHLRILYAPVFDPGYPHQRQTKRGLREALQRVGLVYEWDYLREPTPGLAAHVADWQPHLVLLQIGVGAISEADLVAARIISPEAVFVNWYGDVYADYLLSAPILSIARHVDLQLTVNASVIDEYTKHGIRAAYWQVAWEPVDEDHLIQSIPAVARHDVVFLGNAYTPIRKALGDTLQSMPGVNVGLYGFGWRFPSGDTLYNFTAGAALYRNARIAIGDNQYANERGFVSNRVFEALAHGAFLLHQRVEGLEALTGLQDGVHYVAWDGIEDLQRRIKHWLQPKNEAKRRQIAEAGMAFVREQHNFDARVRQLFNELLPMLEGEREPQPA